MEDCWRSLWEACRATMEEAIGGGDAEREMRAAHRSPALMTYHLPSSPGGVHCPISSHPFHLNQTRAKLRHSRPAAGSRLSLVGVLSWAEAPPTSKFLFSGS